MFNESNIQLMASSDLPKVVAIEQRVMPFGWKANTFRSCLYNHAYECWKLEIDASFVGYCIVYFVGDSAQILNLCIDCPFQGKGYGRNLLCFVLGRCRERAMRKLFLEVRESNIEARNLYRTVGFQKIDQRKDYYESAHGREHADVYSLTLV